MRLSLIVAVAKNGVIGRQGGLPWRLSSDLRRFKQLTMGHHLIMGRKTFESIGRALPGRTTIVLTRDGGSIPDGVTAAHSIDDALRACAGDDEAFIVGGAEIYRQTLPIADRIYLTEVEAEVDGDAWFPEFDRSAWQVVREQRLPAGQRDDYETTFRIFDRMPSADEPRAVQEFHDAR
jgi:dihydrofolate reductase